MRVGGIQGEVDVFVLQARVEELAVLLPVVTALLARVKALEERETPFLSTSIVHIPPESTDH